MQFVMCQEAPEGSIFAEGAFDAMIGQIVPLTLGDTGTSTHSASIGHARLVSAEIVADGHGAKLTLEIIPDEGVTADTIFKTRLPAISFGSQL